MQLLKNEWVECTVFYWGLLTRWRNWCPHACVFLLNFLPSDYSMLFQWFLFSDFLVSPWGYSDTWRSLNVWYKQDLIGLATDKIKLPLHNLFRVVQYKNSMAGITLSCTYSLLKQGLWARHTFVWVLAPSFVKLASYWTLSAISFFCIMGTTYSANFTMLLWGRDEII